jgi:hypothetical protein
MSYVAQKVRTRYVVGRGKNLRYVSPGTSGARQVNEKSEDYYGFWKDEHGKKKCIRFRNCRDREAAQMLLTDHLRKLSRAEAGIGPHPDQERNASQVELEGHLRAYLKSLRDKGRAEQYVKNVERQCRFVFQGLGARVLGDLKRERLREFLESLQTRARGAAGACVPNAPRRRTGSPPVPSPPGSLPLTSRRSLPIRWLA